MTLDSIRNSCDVYALCHFGTAFCRKGDFTSGRHINNRYGFPKTYFVPGTPKTSLELMFDTCNPHLTALGVFGQIIMLKLFANKETKLEKVIRKIVCFLANILIDNSILGQSFACYTFQIVEIFPFKRTGI